MISYDIIKYWSDINISFWLRDFVPTVLAALKSSLSNYKRVLLAILIFCCSSVLRRGSGTCLTNWLPTRTKGQTTNKPSKIPKPSQNICYNDAERTILLDQPSSKLLGQWAFKVLVPQQTLRQCVFLDRLQSLQAYLGCMEWASASEAGMDKLMCFFLCFFWR